MPEERPEREPAEPARRERTVYTVYWEEREVVAFWVIPYTPPAGRRRAPAPPEEEPA